MPIQKQALIMQQPYAANLFNTNQGRASFNALEKPADVGSQHYFGEHM